MKPLEQLVSIRGKLVRFARSVVRDEEDAKDVVQDCFLKLHQMNGELDKVENIESFAMRMVKNRGLDLLKKKKPESWNGDEELSVTFQDAQRIMEAREGVERLHRCLEFLGEKQRQVFYLREIEGYEFREISEIMGLSEDAVRANLSRARTHLFSIYKMHTL